MPLKTKVKVGNITNLSDARYCAGMGVDFLGFPIDTKSSPGVSLEKFKEITNWVSGPEFILEIDEVIDLSEFSAYFPTHIIQVPATLLAALPSAMQTLIVVLDVQAWAVLKSQLNQYTSQVRYILLTNSKGLENRKAEAVTKEVAQYFPVLLGFNLDKNTVDEVLSWSIAGVALHGSNEIRPGIQDYDYLAEVLEKLEMD